MINHDIIHQSFEAAAELHGDITEAVCEDLFKRYPKAEDYFLIKGTPFKEPLKQQMVRDSIYAFFEYLETPEELEISLKYTIPQHKDLGIGVDAMIELLQSVANIACAAIPDSQQSDAKKNWQAIMLKMTDTLTELSH